MPQSVINNEGWTVEIFYDLIVFSDRCLMVTWSLQVFAVNYLGDIQSVQCGPSFGHYVDGILPSH